MRLLVRGTWWWLTGATVWTLWGFSRVARLMTRARRPMMVMSATALMARARERDMAEAAPLDSICLMEQVCAARLGWASDEAESFL